MKTKAFLYSLILVLVVSLALPTGASAAVPGNDNFANAEVLTGIRLSVVRNNIDATKETSEPNHASNIGGKSVIGSIPIVKDIDYRLA